MNRRGITMIELLVALTTAATIALVSVGLFKAAILTYRATARQDTALGAIRKALAGDASRSGLLQAARVAASVQSISGSAPVFVSTSAATDSYTIGAAGLSWANSASGSTFLLAPSVSTISVAYYNLDSSGLIMQSTAASAASMVTVRVSLTASGKDRAYVAYGGARLRNH